MFWFSEALRDQLGFQPQYLPLQAKKWIAASSNSLLLVLQSKLSMAKAKFE